MRAMTMLVVSVVVFGSACTPRECETDDDCARPYSCDAPSGRCVSTGSGAHGSSNGGGGSGGSTGGGSGSNTGGGGGTGGCVADTDCASNETCNNGQCQTAATPTGALGAACTSSANCNTGLFCDGFQVCTHSCGEFVPCAAGVCVSGSCRARCSMPNTTDTCQGLSSCKAGLDSSGPVCQ